MFVEKGRALLSLFHRWTEMDLGWRKSGGFDRDQYSAGSIGVAPNGRSQRSKLMSFEECHQGFFQAVELSPQYVEYHLGVRKQCNDEVAFSLLQSVLQLLTRLLPGFSG